MKALVLVLLPVVACFDDPPPPLPSGPHHQYVIDRVGVPANNQGAHELALDLNGDTVGDNQLGLVLGTLHGTGLDVQPAIDLGVARGGILMLLDVQAESLTSAEAASVELALGGSPVPAPCASDTDPVCGAHLDGGGAFAITARPPGPLLGTIEDGVLTAGPGPLTIQLAFGDAAFELELRAARIELEVFDADGIAAARIGGGIPQQSLDTQLVPALHAAIAAAIARDCGTDCACTQATTGGILLQYLDDGPRDCKVTLPEFRANGVTESLLAPDIEDSTGDDPLLSFSFFATATRATF